MMRQVFLLLCLCSIWTCGQSSFGAAWRQESFPNPQTNAETCRSDRICDPDGILSNQELELVAKRISELETNEHVPCAAPNGEPTTAITTMEPVQMAIALIKRMSLVHVDYNQDREEHAAELFATHLHNKWGVGSDTPCGGTGLLLLLSFQDRALFLSRGAAVQSILTDRRLDKLINELKPLLRSQNYSGALVKAVDTVEHYLQQGEPTPEELRLDMLGQLLPLGMFGCIIAMVLHKSHSRRREQRIYAQVESQLSQLDRSRAEALQGTYQCKSCPICLENFPEQATNETRQDDDNHSTSRTGSDGLPLKLLRCGHVFDETCWSEWVSSGQGNISRCPICQQDVGVGPGDDNVSETEQQVAIPQGNDANDNDRLFRQYNRERNFRLARLGTRFPRYVRADQLQRWTSSTYDGSLANDSSFVENNPRLAADSNQRSSGNMRSSRVSGSSFGGGKSSGGRGGSW